MRQQAVAMKGQDLSFKGKRGLLALEDHDVSQSNNRSGGSVTQTTTVTSVGNSYDAISGNVSMGSEQGSIALQNVQVNAVKMLLKAPTGQVSFLVGTNQSQSQTTTTTNGWLFNAVRQTLETHKTYTQSTINAELEVETGRVVLQEIAGQTTDFLKRLKLNGQAGSSDIIKELMQEEHTMTSQKTRSLSKLAGAVIALSVSLITQGMATPYVSAVWAPAANAAFSGLCSKATVSLIANEGNIGKVVDELTSDQGLKGLAQSMVSASVPGTSGLGVAGDLASRTATGTLTGMAFGAKPTDAFQSSLRGALVSTVGAQLSSTIGDLKADETLNVLTHKIAHGLNGALMGAILEGEKGLLPGAVSAIVAESAAEVLMGTSLSIDASMITSKILGGLSGGLMDVSQGGDGALGVSVGGTVGSTTVENNFLPHIILAASLLYEAADVVNIYLTQGEDAALKALAVKVGVGVATIAVGGPILKAAISKIVASSPALAKVLGTFGEKLLAVSESATEALGSTAVGRGLLAVESGLEAAAQATKQRLGVQMAKNKVIQAEVAKEAAQAAKEKVGMWGTKAQPWQSEFWSAPKEYTFRGQSNKVYQRDDLIDLAKVDPRSGKSNVELMRAGRAPIGSDGKPINLHHTLQKQGGGIAEVTETFHVQNRRAIHINDASIPSGIDRTAFDQWRKEYWISRAQELGGK